MATRQEVHLGTIGSQTGRLVVAGLGLICIVVALTGSSTTDRLPGVILATVVFLIGCLMVAGVIFGSDVIWVIRKGQILIGEKYLFGKLRGRLIKSDEILEMKLQKDRAEFSLVVKLGPGEVLTSPPLPDITQVYGTALLAARLLGLPDPLPVDNPLDTANPEIRLGEPIEPRRGVGNRILVVLFAALLSFPFVHAWWNDALSALGITVWTLGLVVAAVWFRYVPRMSGSSWVIGDRAIRIERLSLNCEPETETVDGNDIEAIDVRTDAESGQHSILVKRRNGTTIRSPDLANRSQAEAVQDEIVRRLNVPARG